MHEMAYLFIVANIGNKLNVYQFGPGTSKQQNTVHLLKRMEHQDGTISKP